MCLLQDIFLHICEVLWVVVGVMNCNFMILLPLLQLLWFYVLKPMGSLYTSKPIKTICDSFWHLSNAVCHLWVWVSSGKHQPTFSNGDWDFLISCFLQFYCVPRTLCPSEKWNHIDRNLIGGKSELRIIPVGGVKGNCRPYLNPLLALTIHLLPTKLSLTLMLHCQFDHSRAKTMLYWPSCLPQG